jgi:hypothetical protein
MSAVKRLEFISDRMANIILSDCWCDINVLNAHAPTEKKIEEWRLLGCYTMWLL